MTSSMSIPNLHDATLEQIDLDWRTHASDARVHVQLFNGPRVSLVVEDLREFRMTRNQEWGPTDAINEARVSPLEHGQSRLLVQMQTGDEILLAGTRIYAVRAADLGA